MTIDERLAKLAERHEALLRSLEVTAHMQRQNTEHPPATRSDNKECLAVLHRQTEEQFARNGERLGQLMDALNRLESHRRHPRPR